MKKIIYGYHAVKSGLAKKSGNYDSLYVQKSCNKKNSEIIDLARNLGVPVKLLSSEELNDITGNSVHQGLCLSLKNNLVMPSLDELLSQKQDGLKLLILDGVVDPQNLGSCLRSAATFSFDAIIVPKNNAVHVNATVRKVASGAAEIVPVFVVSNLVRTLTSLKSKGIWLYGFAENSSCYLPDVDFANNTGLVMGGEEKGIRKLVRENCDYTVQIPTASTFSTLNVAVAAAIAMYAAVGSK